MHASHFAIMLSLGSALLGGVSDAAPSSSAVTVACDAGLSIAARMTCLQDQDQLLTEEIQVATDQNKLANVSGSDVVSDRARNITIPNVLSIYGFGHQALTAVLAYPEGRSLVVKAGEVVPGGFLVKVVSSTPAEVVLSRDGHEYKLLMGTSGPSINASAINVGPVPSAVAQPSPAFTLPAGYQGASPNQPAQ